jgi:hypothetical protein
MTGAPEQSFREFVNRSSAGAGVGAWATRYVEGFNAARAERISVQSLAAQEEAAGRIEGDRTFRLEGGYASLLDVLREEIRPKRVRFRLGTAVEEVRWRPGHVEARARIAGRVPLTVEAPRASVTIPLGVLQSGSIRFDPMPDTLEAACRGNRHGAGCEDHAALPPAGLGRFGAVPEFRVHSFRRPLDAGMVDG